MAVRNINAKRIYTELEPAFEGGIVHNDFIKAGMFVRQTEAQKLLIKKGYRVLDGENTTLCMVTGGLVALTYKLINNPSTADTQESDWELINTTNSAVAPVGEFDVYTNLPHSSGLYEGRTFSKMNGKFKEITLDDIKNAAIKHLHPENIVLSISGNLSSDILNPDGKATDYDNMQKKDNNH